MQPVIYSLSDAILQTDTKPSEFSLWQRVAMTVNHQLPWHLSCWLSVPVVVQQLTISPCDSSTADQQPPWQFSSWLSVPVVVQQLTSCHYDTGLGICSIAHRSFAQIALRSNERLWAIRSDHSGQIAHLLFCSQKKSNLYTKFDLNLIFWYIFCIYFCKRAICSFPLF